MKLKKLLVLSVVAITIRSSLFVHAQDSLSDEKIVTTDVLPKIVKITGTKTTSTLKKNIDGNQGTTVYTATIDSNNVNGNYSIKVSGFSNNMSSVNVSAYAGSTYLSGQMDMTPDGTVTFKIPSDALNKTFKIVMSTNSSVQGTCNLSIY